MASSNHTKTTVTYKNVGDLPICADVYISKTTSVSEAGRPVVFYMHGGAFIRGDRETFGPALIEQITNRGWMLISIDHRLAPEVKFSEIWSDCEDAWKWLHQEGPKQFGPLDLSRVAVFGASAGGMLALIAGYRFSPKPKVIVDYYGCADITKKLGSYGASKELSDEEIRELYSERVLTGVPITAKDGKMYSDERRSLLLSSIVQKGIWAEHVLGFDPSEDSNSQLLAPWLPEKHITSDFPPTFVLHGTKDSIVPFTQSLRLVEVLKKNNVIHEFLVAEGKDHVYDYYMDAEHPEFNALLAPTYQFLDKYL
ncbi:uncharacterized protein VTP21DRAFT_8276 [Calcarisporiella thermophila]|uniref:uncharacterized protein n=1 Tax=Calcarisporiella thermophila TaxID=911321 RepID=UPI003742CE81